MVIFDLDLTLADTRSVESLREARRWRDVMAKLPSLPIYDGIHGLLADLHARNVPLAILTRSPSMIPKAFIEHHSWPIGIVVGYHDVTRRKPDPEGILRAMSAANADPARTFHVGDDAIDTQAAHAAGITAIGATWGLSNPSSLLASK